MWEVVKKIIIQRKRKAASTLKVLDEVSNIDTEGDPQAEEFLRILRDIKLFSNKADATLDTLTRADSNWFVGTFMKMVK